MSDIPVEGIRDRPRKAGSKREKQSKKRVLRRLSAMLEANADQYQEWMAKVAAENPAKALTLTVAMLEYVVPKLGRVEQTGTVDVKHSHFVPVIERETPPSLLAAPKALEGEFTEVQS